MRYAINGNISIAEVLEYDVVVVGAGIAGLYTALNIDENLSCLILAKESIEISNSWLAQGGIAAAIGGDDTPRFHLDDTIAAGAGLCDEEAVTVLVNEGPGDIANLMSLRVPFDLDEYGELQITREGGHHKNRVVHAGGDATGRETVKTLAHIVSLRKNITFSGHSCLFDILTDRERVTGAVIRCNDSEFLLIKTNNIVIATGGIGQVYKSSTNPSVATGDGLAAAMRAGAAVTNIEFIQFHPTGLWTPVRESRDFLISEAVRGEGGLLVNSAGERFMESVHELGELAPRDVVARGIVSELQRGGGDHVYIDIRSKPEDYLKTRFPTIYTECLRHGINIAHDRIPVRPVQHYLMGGISTDLHGRTNISGLFACGEAANTGVHGANRLASNSMLECLVFGRRAAEYINNSGAASENAANPLPQGIPERPLAVPEYSAVRAAIKDLMDTNCAVVRTVPGLKYAFEKVTAALAKLEAVFDGSNDYIETLNIATVAKAILEAAIKRPESIGSHYIV
ncbi:MAG: L-aspartate oxidase [Oscillospiraceae bacterium]|nr:L-aspartate oxidase [Oscillospiraceae bacterium]